MDYNHAGEGGVDVKGWLLLVGLNCASEGGKTREGAVEGGGGPGKDAGQTVYRRSFGDYCAGEGINMGGQREVG